MAKFTLQRVLDLKRRREEAVGIRLAEARAAAADARRSEAELEAQRQEGAARRMAHGAAVTVGHLQNSSYVMNQMDQQLAEARRAAEEADADVTARLAEFTTALQERRVLDRLKVKREEAAFAEESKVEQMKMDAIALTRFVRADKGEMEGET